MLLLNNLQEFGSQMLFEPIFREHVSNVCLPPTAPAPRRRGEGAASMGSLHSNMKIIVAAMVNIVYFASHAGNHKTAHKIGVPEMTWIYGEGKYM